MASEIGTFTESAADSSGKVNTTVGKYVVVWRKQPDGQWRVTADIFNSDP
jgi:ketosteroid isomerase-like protein